MPKLKPETQAARIENILDAAEICFAKSGFHACTMADICRQAQISPGALYGHFKSKEELIKGIVERDRSTFAEGLDTLTKSGDLMSVIDALGQHYAVNEPTHKRILCLEIGAESTRNEKVGETFRSIDKYVQTSFAELFSRARDKGEIKPTFDTATLAQLFMLIGDGLFWRRAIDPDFDAKAAMPAVMSLIETLLNPTSKTPPPAEPLKRDELTEGTS